MDVVEQQEKKALGLASERLIRCIENNGVIHVFGCGHSHLLGEELFYRAGGLVPISPILIEDLMLHKGAARSSALEKRNHYAQTFMESVNIRPQDVMIVVSTSGRNPVPIDVALIAKEKRTFVIGITSTEYAKHQKSRHLSGKFLYEVCDLVIDTHIPVGDALIEHEEDFSFGPASTVIGTAIVNGLAAETAHQMIQRGVAPPLFKSGNIDGSADHNEAFIRKYKERIPLLEGTKPF